MNTGSIHWKDCPVEGCICRIPNEHLWCKTHWYRVPERIRAEILYERRQMTNRLLTQGQRKAAQQNYVDAVQRAAKEIEARSKPAVPEEGVA